MVIKCGCPKGEFLYNGKSRARNHFDYALNEAFTTMPSYIHVPANGQSITLGQTTPHFPIIPFIEGDGVGVDIMPVMRKVVDAAVAQAYGDQQRICWMEIYAGDQAIKRYGSGHYLPEETIHALKKYHVAIKGPLSTPVSGGIRSLNVALRQQLDLYQCVRPIRYFQNVPSVLKHPERTNMVIFRENTEDIYAGIEWQAGSEAAKRIIRFLQHEMGVHNIRFPLTSSIGIKPVSKEGTERLVHAAIRYAIDHNRRSVTLVHKGNIMKFTEGCFRDWGYQLAQTAFGAELLEGGPWMQLTHPTTHQKILIKDVIADAFLQQILLHPADYDVIATLNLNGDYISDALAAQVGGIGIAPGANISDQYALFEATHGTVPKYAGQNKVNPGSIILSAEMMLRHIGWTKAADTIVKSMEQVLYDKQVTYDLARFIDDAKEVSCSGFGDAMIASMSS